MTRLIHCLPLFKISGFATVSTLYGRPMLQPCLYYLVQASTVHAPVVTPPTEARWNAVI